MTMLSVDSIFGALATLVVSIIFFWYLWSRKTQGNAAEIQKLTEEIRDLEKMLHVKEREFLDERNQIEIAKSDAVRASKQVGFEEGRLLGQAEKQRDHLTELTNLREELSKHHMMQIEGVAADARAKLRAEYELQTKIFTVKICPYVKITEDKSLFNKKHEFVSGYQYQLLVNGIPAFSPHLVPERTEIKSEINPALEQMVVGLAEKAAEAAINMYLGGNIKLVQRAPAVIDRGTK
jgi:hypothetical protein